jgi:xylulokinase
MHIDTIVKWWYSRTGLKMSVMGIDIGTGSCKSRVFAEDGTLLWHETASYTCTSPRPDRIELDPAILWRRVGTVIRRSARAVEDTDPVSVLAMATMGDSLVALGPDGAPLGPYIMYSDRRSAPQAARLARAIGAERVFAITGMPPHPMNTLTKILWLQENEPEVFRRASRFLCVEDFVMTRLGLPPTASHSTASRTMAFSIRECRWSEQMLGAARVPREKLAQTVPSGAIVGVIPRDAARGLGLREGVRVVAGGLDQACGILGADCASPGSVQDSMGTQEILAFTMPKAGFTPAARRRLLSGRYSVNSHVLPDAFMIMGMIINPGQALRWAARVLRAAPAGGGRSLDALVEAALSGRPPTHVSFLPYVSGRGTPDMDAAASGAVLGLDLTVSGLDLLRAALQGIAYEAAINVDVMEGLGLAITRFRCVGGGACSDATLQLRSDVLGRKVARMRDLEAAAVGAAVLAGVGGGVWGSWKEAAALLNGEERSFLPRPEYADFYKRHRELHGELARLVAPSYRGPPLLSGG